MVSIPQAVSTVATGEWDDNLIPTLKSFNTASGKHCCNAKAGPGTAFDPIVSIPQAVSTVATVIAMTEWRITTSFNTASGKHCCN